MDRDIVAGKAATPLLPILEEPFFRGLRTLGKCDLEGEQLSQVLLRVHPYDEGIDSWYIEFEGAIKDWLLIRLVFKVWARKGFDRHRSRQAKTDIETHLRDG
jgi:hypothetical protein